MTHKATLTQSGSTDKLTESGKLASAIEAHCVKEKASFHTPGHKGGTYFRCGQNLWAMDVTELPGLDELAYASGVLANVQERAAKIWNAAASFISVNGATAGILAAILSVRARNTHILVPRNAHRSIVNALVLSGLQPIWYEPKWDETWATWSEVDRSLLANLIESNIKNLAAVVIVTPTYSGAISDAAAITATCHAHGIPLIVDEAHGAHAPHAVTAGADIVIHSLHKTLSAMTQTGVVHVTRESLVEPEQVRLALNMVQSSSPNYVLMSSIEQALSEIADGKRISGAIELSRKIRSELLNCSKHIHLYESMSQDPLHILISHDHIGAEILYERLVDHGIFAETVVGNGVLLLLGAGSTANDMDVLLSAVRAIDSIGTKNNIELSHRAHASKPIPIFGDQVISPQQAYFAQTESISAQDAAGRIAAECVAPCPPGTPLLVPGQCILASAIELCKLPELRVVVESQQGEQ